MRGRGDRAAAAGARPDRRKAALPRRAAADRRQRRPRDAQRAASRTSWRRSRRPGPVRRRRRSDAAAPARRRHDCPRPSGDLRLALGVEENELAPFWHDFEVLAAPDRDRRHRERQDQPAQAHRPSGGPALPAGRGPDRARRLPPRAVRHGAGGVPARLRGLGRRRPRHDRRRARPARCETARPGTRHHAGAAAQRDWWTGPQLFVLVDDYDMVGGNP